MAEDTPSSSKRAQQNLQALNSKVTNTDATEVKKNRQASTRMSSVQVAPEKPRTPLDSYRNLGIAMTNDGDENEYLKEVREISRNYYRVHHLVPTAIDIYSRFPVQGLEFDCKDEELKEFYHELFIENLDYESFLVEFSREFYIAGEATSLGEFNETLGVWTSEEILNPDQLTVEYLPLENDYSVKIEPPDYLKELVNNQQPLWEYNALKEEQPDLVEAVRKNSEIEVSSVLISRMVNKTSPWDLRGTPHLLRAFRQLMMEESLNNAQDAVADRLYAPFILATLGMRDIGDGQPWIPNADQLDEFNDAINQALLGDFKLLTHHFGIDIKSVFGRESMPRFDADYDRIERKILQTWGIGESLLSGSSNGAYASSALNRELVTQLMSTHQKNITRHYKKRAEIVAEAQEHFDYELKGDRRIPIYEEVLAIDPETGKQYVKKRPKLLIPDMKFKTLNLRDENQERKFIADLKAMGVPISDRALAVNIDLDLEDEIDKSIEDRVNKTVAEQRFLKRTVERLENEGLPIPPELMMQLGMMPPGPPPGEGGPEGGAPDLSGPTPTPNVAPAGKPSGPGGPSDGGDLKLPQNQIRQRPEISDEMRAASNSSSARKFSRDYKSVKGLRDHLKEESVQEALERPVLVPRSLRRIREEN